MVIASESYRMSAVGNGVTTTFPCTFRIDDDDEVTVFTLTSAGVLTTLTKTTDYTIDPNQIGDDDGFDIETVSPVANGTAIAAIRNVPLTQTVDLQSQGTISRAGLEEALDRLVMMIQQLAEENTRTLKITPAADVNDDLTELVPEAGKAIAWNAAGDGLENVDPGTVALATPADNSVTTAKILDAAVTLAKLADLAEARMIGRAAGAGTGVPQALTAAQILTLLAITPDASTVESSGTTLRVKAAGIDSAQLATYSVIFDKLSDSVRVTYRNMLVNGMGWIAQRPTYTASVSGTYGYGKCDRWAGAITGSTVAGTLTQSTTSTVSGTMGFGIKWSAVTTTGSGVVKFRQRIEAKNTLKYLGKDLKFTCWLTHDIGSTTTASITLRSADVLDDFSATTLIQTVAGSVSIPTGTATRVTCDFSPVSDALTNGIELEVAVTVGAVTNKYVELTVAQLWIDDGSTSEGFEVLPWSVEYERCQRYYWKTFAYATAPAQNVGSYVGAIGVQCETATPTNNYGTQVFFAVQMRTLPTITFYNPSASNTKWRNITDGNDSGASSAKANLSINGFMAINAGKDSTDEGDFHAVHATAEAEL